MSETLCVDVVNGLDELLGVVAHNSLVEGAGVGDVVEQLTAMDKLANDVGNLDLSATLFVPDSILVKLEIFHDMLVVEGLNRLYFISQ